MKRFEIANTNLSPQFAYWSLRDHPFRYKQEISFLTNILTSTSYLGNGYHFRRLEDNS